jgi:hypothetical protein
MHKVERRASGSLALVLMAIVGGIAGFGVTARKVGACSCIQPEWTLQFQSATASDGTSDHKKYWPTEGGLQAYEGFAWFSDTGRSAGVVSGMRAGK